MNHVDFINYMNIITVTPIIYMLFISIQLCISISIYNVLLPNISTYAIYI